jgi:hypothetical protein
MSLINWRRTLSFLTEAIGLMALFFAPDAEQRAFLLVPIALALLVVGVRFSFWALFAWVGSIVVCGLFLGWQGGLSIPTITTAGLVAVHSSLWLAKPPTNLSLWRMGIAFMALIVAGILAPEAYIFILIFLFAIIASVQLVFRYLEDSFKITGVDLANRPVERSFFVTVICLSLGIFLLGLILFPLLPRNNWSGGMDSSVAGYGQTVSFRYSTREWLQADSRPLVWMEALVPWQWNLAVPRGLLRGKVLDHFDGVEWHSGTRSLSVKSTPSEPTKENSLGEARLSRVPFSIDTLLVPYSAHSVGGRGSWNSAGEWADPGREEQSITYSVAMGAGMQTRRDPPLKVHLLFPDEEKLAGVREEGLRLKKEIAGERRSLDAFMNYFKDFSSAEMPVASALSAKHPISTFLFETKSGHCELFATSLALLLRASGIPSRLVVGFRATLPSNTEQIIKFRGRDAHVWVEAWDGEKGWVVLDPTPVGIAPTLWWSPVEGIYDWVNMFWGQYILGFEWDRRLFLNAFRRVGEYGGYLIFFAFLLLLALKGRGIWQRFLSIRTPREKLAAWRKKNQLNENWLSTKEGKQWLNGYHSARFGRRQPSSTEVEEVKHLYFAGLSKQSSPNSASE